METGIVILQPGVERQPCHHQGQGHLQQQVKFGHLITPRQPGKADKLSRQGEGE